MQKKFTSRMQPLLLKSASLASVLLLLVVDTAVASGGSGFPRASGPIGPGLQRQVDEIYEFGKAAYKGRIEGTEKIKYCVKHKDKLKKVKRSTVKQFRNGPTLNFARALLDCKQPDRLALTTMEREHVPAVLYYLNKRYRLELEES